ncbi:UNVERIFIED_CONTAM: hypothetical protein Sindi_0103700 [Sesamum indicum]
MQVNDLWVMRWSRASYIILTPRTSDHFPLVLRGDAQQQLGGMFSFDNYLALSFKFIPSVRNIWRHHIVGLPMSSVMRKLKALKPVFRQQRRNKGDLSHNVQLAKGCLGTAQRLLSMDRHNSLLLSLEHCLMIYARVVQLEYVMLQQRAKMQWMKGGDQCSRVFFWKISQRHTTRRIFQIDDELGHTYDEVKFAIFDISTDKAPGPDRYTLGFYQAAWPIVGAEVTQAIRECYGSSTHPQGAFYRVYNQQLLPPRYAFKVNIRKAYDIKWDFLISTLQLFGFPDRLIHWVDECITTTSFSVGINGKPHGFFAGARGLRQGDPKSPYLFVLIMEVLNLILQQLIDQDRRFIFLEMRAAKIGEALIC